MATTKILIIRLSSIGDIVLTSPIIRCLKMQIPNAEIHFITKAIYKEIVEDNVHLNKVYTIEKSVDEIALQLQKEQYNLVIDLHNNIRSQQIKSLLKTKNYTYNKQQIKRFLLINFKINWLNNHIVDRYFTAVKKLHIINDNKGLDYFIAPKNEIEITDLPFTHITGFCVIAIGTQHFTKNIPLEKLMYLCENITIPIILVGNANDAYLGLQLAAIDDFKIFNACGKYTISQTASIIKRAKYIITGDTGMMHIAAAFKKRTIAIFGSTTPNLGFLPYNNETNTVVIENNNINCRPCHKHGLNKCPKKHFKCMNDLDMEKVMQVL